MRERWERFCREYLVDMDPVQAAIRAGYDPKHAAQSAARLLGKDEIRRRVGASVRDTDAGQRQCIVASDIAGQQQDIADEKEVMRTLTRILRGEVEAPVKVSETCRAAELLNKRLNPHADRSRAGEEVPVEDARAKLLAGLLRLRDA